MSALRDGLRVGCLAALLSLPAAAQETSETAPQPAPPPLKISAPDMQAPRMTSFDVDWEAARAQAPETLAALNAAAEKILPNIAASGVPVLLPFDAAAFLRDQAQGKAGDAGTYFSDFHAPTVFYPGPSGYDAAFQVQPKDTAGRGRTSVRPIEVQLSASSVIYELDGPAVDQGLPVPELEHDFPGIRRMFLESRLRYVFTRFGVPYFVSILCSDGRRYTRPISCREADQVALRFVKALQVVGGAPAEPATAAPPTIARPDQVSPDFTYDPPGDLLPGTGMQGHVGRADMTVYAAIRFPMAHAPAYINSQSFMNWGNCDLTGIVRLGGRGKEEAYRCRVNDIRLFIDETRNYAYPWRDNFCEHRYYLVTQCPGGLGHQGEDIRPSSCKLRNEDADRCEPYQEQVVAVREGMVWRNTGDEALYLTADGPGEHIRFRYLHMNPHMLDLAGMVSGRTVKEGDELGLVGDYGAREGGTTYHLHFNMQVPTRQGWLFVNPYMTLVASYERLIGARGQVVEGVPLAASPAPDGTPGPHSSAIAPSNPAPADGMVVGNTTRAPKSETGSERKERERPFVAERCATRFFKGYRRRVCWSVAAEPRRRESRAPLF
jgi:hypothetical protein